MLKSLWWQAEYKNLQGMDQAVTQFSAYLILVITEDTEGHKVLFEIRQTANVSMQYIHKKTNKTKQKEA